MNDSSSPTEFVAPEPSELAPLFPGYEIHDLIATGGMGAVYRAVQKSLDRTVAVKILPMEFSEDAEFCAGFEAEAKAMARLNHPNLIAVYDFGAVNGMLFIVMEFVPGKSIYHSAYGQAIDPRDVIRLVTGVCHGLAHAHENGILHRDIKPSNILLTPQAEPKIGDFGLARPVERKTQAGEVIFGTPGYTAPEVVDAPEAVDHRADLFSVGVLLHELLTGKLPADDSRPASLISGCDVRFDAIIRRATNPVPANRYSTAAEIAAELQQITTAGTAVPQVKSPGGPRPGVPRPPQHRRTSAVGAKRKPMNLTWIGPLLAIAIMAFSWHTFMNMKPRVVVIDDPAAESTSKPSSGNELQKAEGPEGFEAPQSSSQSPLPLRPPTQPPLPPTVAKTQDVAGPGPERKPAGEIKESRNGGTTVFNATDLAAMRDKRNQHATVQGRVLKTGVSNSKTARYLNFTEPYANSVSVMMLVSDAPNEFTEQKLQEYVGKSIQFSGIVEENQGALRIHVHSLTELKIVDGEPPVRLASGTLESARETPPGIPGAAKYFNGKWYRVYEQECSWQEARDQCEALGGQIIVIPDQATNEFAKGLVGGRQLWLGATDEKQEKRWLWVDGTEVVFQLFDRSQPDNKNTKGNPENYLVIRANGLWNDVDQKAEKFGYICEWKDKPAGVIDVSTTNPTAESVALANWKNKALRDFPALNDASSELARNVKALKEKKELLTPSFFANTNPQWPYLLAKEASVQLTNKADVQQPVFLDDLTEVDFKVGFGSLGKHGSGPGSGTALVKGIKPEHSLLPHPPSNGSSFVTYALNGKFSQFSGMSTVADIAKQHPFRFSIKGDGKTLWRSKIIQNGKDAEDFSVSVKGINKLELEIECPENCGTAWAMWLSPRLLQ